MTEPAPHTPADGDDIIWVTREEVLADWNALFDAHPWLEGLTSNGTCASITCCPPPRLRDRDVWNRARGLLFLGCGDTSARTLTRSLLTGN